MAAAAVATFAAYLDATSAPTRTWVVAADDVPAGREITADDLAVVALDLPDGLAGRAFDDPERLVGALAIAPIARYDLVLASGVTDGGGGLGLAELSFPISPARAVGGALRRGDRVDVVASYGDGAARTEVVAGDVRLLDVERGDAGIGAGGDLTLTVGVDGREVVLALAHAVSHAELLVVRTSGGAVR